MPGRFLSRSAGFRPLETSPLQCRPVTLVGRSHFRKTPRHVPGRQRGWRGLVPPQRQGGAACATPLLPLWPELCARVRPDVVSSTGPNPLSPRPASRRDPRCAWRALGVRDARSLAGGAEIPWRGGNALCSLRLRRYCRVAMARRFGLGFATRYKALPTGGLAGACTCHVAEA